MPTHEAKFPKGEKMSVEEVAAVVGDSFKEMNENPPESVVKVREEMEGKVARQRLTWKLAATETKVASWEDDLIAEIRADYDRGAITSGERGQLIKAVQEADSKKEAEKVLEDARKMRTAASGLYGFNKATQNACESASKKLSKAALRIAKNAFAKDAEVVSFLQAHVKREGSRSAKVLLAAMKEIGPKIASEMRGGRPKEAGAAVYGLYGFKARTADLGLEACKEVRAEAGRISADLHHRKADSYEKITGFLKQHSREGKCAYAGMLLSCYPDADMRLASTRVAAPSSVGGWLEWED